MNQLLRSSAVRRGSLALAAIFVATLTGCMRGGISELPPVHLVLDMDFQEKVKAQSSSHFFHDGRGMRLPVAGTVAQGSLKDANLASRDANNALKTKNPVPTTEASLARGRQVFEINCAVCHGLSGQGGNGPTANGIVGRRWPVLIPNFHFVEGKDNRVPMMPDGEFFEVITNGKGTMPAYGARITPADRWAVVQYIRVLQSLSK